jgi:hypothetical protein
MTIFPLGLTKKILFLAKSGTLRFGSQRVFEKLTIPLRSRAHLRDYGSHEHPMLRLRSQRRRLGLDRPVPAGRPAAPRAEPAQPRPKPRQSGRCHRSEGSSNCACGADERLFKIDVNFSNTLLRPAVTRARRHLFRQCLRPERTLMRTSSWPRCNGCKAAGCRRTTSPRNWASAFGHCAGGRENIVRKQRQERAQHANPLPRLKSCRLSQAVNRQSRHRPWRVDYLHDRTDRIGDIVVGQAAGGAQNGGRDLETTFGRHAGIVPRPTPHPEQ